MQDIAIEVDHLRKVYAGHVAVDDLSFQVGRGELFGLLGPNGAGKTTTIRALMGIIRPDAGVLCVLGTSPAEARRRVGYLPEERGLYRSLPVEECLIYLGELKGLARARARRRARDLLEQVGLGDWRRHKIQELSRGMQQKVQVLASIIHDPELIILDEPFQGLDPLNIDLVRVLIRDLRAAGKTIVLSAHEMSLVESLCERILLIDRGRPLLYGALAELKQQFAPNALRIRPPLALDGWPEVLRTETADGQQTIYLAHEANPRAFLHKLLDQGLPIEEFTTATVSLDQIFVTAIKGQTDV